MRCSARFLEEPGADAVAAAEIAFPDGTKARAGSPEAAELLSAYLGRAVTVWPKTAAARPVFPSRALESCPPLAAHFDAYPVHLLTTTTLAALGRLRPASRFDPRRFRPNFVIETAGEEGFPELDWRGVLRLGGAALTIEKPTSRCVMTALEQDGLGRDLEVLNTIVNASENKLGRYATVAAPGAVAVGDSVDLFD